MPSPAKTRIIVLHLTKHSYHGVVLHAVDAEAADCEALESGEEDAAQCVADGNAVAGLQGSELEFAERVVGFQH